MSEEEKRAIEELKKDLLIHECWEANNLDKNKGNDFCKEFLSI